MFSLVNKVGGMKVKKILVLTLIFIVSILISLCDSSITKVAKEQSNITENKQDVRETIWNQLISKDNAIQGNWQDGELSRTTLYEDAGIIINDKSYIGKEVYMIDFQTKSLRMPNNIIVYASMDNNKIIGYGIVD